VGRFGFLVGGLGGASVVTGVIWRAFVNQIEGVAVSRGVVLSTDETAKVTSTDQFFYFILECFAFFCSVAMVTVVAAIFGHISVRRCSCFAWWRD